MKKIAIVALLVCALAMPAYAQSRRSSQQDEDLDLTRLRAQIVRMKQEVDKLIKDVVTVPGDTTGALSGFGQDVRVDMIDNEKNVVVKADLPGMAKDKIDITLQQGKLLTIAGSREVMQKVESPGMVRQERMVGKFQRTIELPVECKNEGIKADYKDGVLTIEIPKKEAAKPESVKIKVD